METTAIELPETEETILEEVLLQELLRVTKRTLQRWREGGLEYIKDGRKTYYRLGVIIDLLGAKPNQVMDEVDFRKELSISARTSLRWRRKGMILYRKAGKHIYYLKRDVAEIASEMEGVRLERGF